MSIKTARKQLLAIADRLEAGALGRPAMAQEIRNIINDEMWRASPVRRSPNRLRKVDETTAASIRAYAEANPTASQIEIAQAFNTGPGRVSEALNWMV